MLALRALAGALLLSAVLAAAPRSAAACSTVDPEHAAFTSLLRRHVADGVVDYGAWKREGESALTAYLRTLGGVCREDFESWSERRKLAFWINAYNAATIALILEHYPVKSIRAIGWLPLAAFREAMLPLRWRTGESMSLDEIEHEVLRKEFKEPRIHFAIVCAARSCPRLASEAYTGDRLEGQLERAAHAFLADPKRNRYSRADGTLYLSKLFDWFADDFVAAAGSVPAYVAPYFGDPTAATIRAGVSVIHLQYDWALNGR